MKKNVSLTLNKQFKRLYYRGKSTVDPLIVTYAIRNKLDYCRIGITASKKIGNAVHRNRARRIIKAAIREANLPKSGWDFVFVARSKTPYSKSTIILPVITKQIETLTK
ncbi:MAG: ribonuclease P protein component [Oscillospiraceae bacterium]